MKRSKRFKPVVKVAENHEQEAARVLGSAQTALTQAQQRLGELKQYREEYISRFHTTGAVGMSAAQMVDYRAFLAKLDQAIVEQERVVEQAAAHVEQQRQEWFARRGKVKMLDTVVARYQADERRDADRKEQGDQDERAQHTKR
jgi:flagellar FliJ protein